MSHLIRKITKPITNIIHAIPGGDVIAPIALTLAGQPELTALLKGTQTLNRGGSLGRALGSAFTNYAASAVGGNDTIFGNSISGALKSGIGSIGDAASGALGKVGDATGLSSLYNDASGALGDAYKGVSDSFGKAYQGSDVQKAFNSGSDALESIGIGSGATTTSAAPVGGGSSSYGSSQPDFNFGQPVVRGTASTALNSVPSDITNLSDITNNGSNIGGNVASNSSNYLAPIASIGIGSAANNSAQDALLKQAKNNRALIKPYMNFNFSPGDLTQDPGYQFNLAQGDRALSRRQAANGNYFSGAAAKELQDYGQGLADNTYNSAFDRALRTNNQGLTGALAGANINDSIGNINATSAINQGNLYSGAFGNILGGNSFTNSGALQGQTDIQALLRRLGVA